MVKFVSKKGILIVLFLLVITISVQAHSNILFDIDLDFDPEFEEKVIQSAQKYLKTTKKPASFGYDKGLITVNFDEDYDKDYVKIEPYGFLIYGFGDKSLTPRSGKTNYNKEQRKEIAENILEQIPKEFRKQLQYGEERQGRIQKGVYTHTWYRYVEGMYSFGDYLEVEIDGVDGKIISWKLNMFEYISQDAVLTPAISAEVAESIALLKYNAEPVEYEEILVLIEGRPTWITKMKKLYPQFVAVDALDGSIIFTGALREKTPENYNVGAELQVLETDFITQLKN